MIAGNQTLFVRRDEVERAWGWIDGVADAWSDLGMNPKPYAAGSWGPAGAFALLERAGRPGWMSSGSASLLPLRVRPQIQQCVRRRSDHGGAIGSTTPIGSVRS